MAIGIILKKVPLNWGITCLSCILFSFCAKDNKKITDFGFDPINLIKDTSYLTGELSQINSDLFVEASGIASSTKYPGHYYIHNDGSNPTEIYLVDSSGLLKAIIDLKGINNRDWEDICTGPGPIAGKTYVYLADIGDNQAIHSDYSIYRFEEPDLKLNQSSPANVDIDKISQFKFNYPDNKSYNAEALMIDPKTQKCYVVTKSKYSSVYSISLTENTTNVVTAKLIVTLPITEVTGGDISDTGSILLKDYTRVYLWSNTDSTSVDSLITGVPVECKYTIEPQGEAICWSPGQKSYLTISEVTAGIKQYLITYKRKS